MAKLCMQVTYDINIGTEWLSCASRLHTSHIITGTKWLSCACRLHMSHIIIGTEWLSCACRFDTSHIINGTDWLSCACRLLMLHTSHIIIISTKWQVVHAGYIHTCASNNHWTSKTCSSCDPIRSLLPLRALWSHLATWSCKSSRPKS